MPSSTTSKTRSRQRSMSASLSAVQRSSKKQQIRPRSASVRRGSKKSPSSARVAFEIPRSAFQHVSQSQTKQLLEAHKEYIRRIKGASTRLNRDLKPETIGYRKLRDKKRVELLSRNTDLDVGLARCMSKATQDELAFQNYWLRRRIATMPAGVNNKLSKEIKRTRKLYRQSSKQTSSILKSARRRAKKELKQLEDATDEDKEQQVVSSAELYPQRAPITARRTSSKLSKPVQKRKRSQSASFRQFFDETPTHHVTARTRLGDALQRAGLGIPKTPGTCLSVASAPTPTNRNTSVSLMVTNEQGQTETITKTTRKSDGTLQQSRSAPFLNIPSPNGAQPQPASVRSTGILSTRKLRKTSSNGAPKAGSRRRRRASSSTFTRMIQSPLALPNVDPVLMKRAPKERKARKEWANIIESVCEPKPQSSKKWNKALDKLKKLNRGKVVSRKFRKAAQKVTLDRWMKEDSHKHPRVALLTSMLLTELEAKHKEDVSSQI